MQLLKPIFVINFAITCVLAVSQAPNNVSSARPTYNCDATSHGQPSAFSPYHISRRNDQLFSHLVVSASWFVSFISFLARSSRDWLRDCRRQRGINFFRGRIWKLALDILAESAFSSFSSVLH